MSNINVVIADDNERIRQNLQEIVSRECDMTLVGSASDGMDALSMIGQATLMLYFWILSCQKWTGLESLKK